MALAQRTQLLGCSFQATDHHLGIWDQSFICDQGAKGKSIEGKLEGRNNWWKISKQSYLRVYLQSWSHLNHVLG